MPTNDKTPLVLPFILSHLSTYTSPQKTPNRPLLLALNGLQGSGKTTLVSTLSNHLSASSIPHITISIDDFYLPFPAQQSLAAAHPDNPLLQHRGGPGTHDLPLLLSTLSSLTQGKQTLIPRYDKSLHSGAGDRLPKSAWTSVNTPGTPLIRLILLEGWFLGFRSISPALLSSRATDPTTKTLQNHRLENLTTINDLLRPYEALTEQFDAFVQLDAWELDYVYEWRLQAERELREQRGSGMTDKQVKSFVDGYYPAYELYLADLSGGLLSKGPRGEERNLRIVVGKERQVMDVTTS